MVLMIWRCCRALTTSPLTEDDVNQLEAEVQVLASNIQSLTARRDELQSYATSFRVFACLGSLALAVMLEAYSNAWLCVRRSADSKIGFYRDRATAVEKKVSGWSVSLDDCTECLQTNRCSAARMMTLTVRFDVV